MAKKLLQYYTFDASTRTIVIDGIYGLDRFLMITNVTDNIIMYIFSNPDFNFTSYSIDTDAETTTVVLAYDSTAMSDTDELQIFIEQEGQEFKPAEPYIDAVSKFRVTNPQNLIDTDFEYGLQSTKWETLELVKNIPTFYSRNGDESLDITAMTRTNGSEIISVTTENTHGLATGNPIIVQGSDSISANGAFVVTKIVDTYNFQYKSKANQTATGSILDTYTQVFIGSVYQGTEFQLSDLNSVVTDAGNPSTLTVTTETPTNFNVGTSFFLSNSVGSKSISFDASTAVTPNNTALKEESWYSQEKSDDQDTSGWAIGRWQPIKWTPKKAKFYVAGTDSDATITVDTTAETMTFTDGPHGFSTGDAVMHYLGLGNTLPGGMIERWYYVTAVDDYTLKFFFTKADQAADTNPENITSAGVNGGYCRGCFAECIIPTSVNQSTNEITFDQDIPYSGNDAAYVVGYGRIASFTQNVAYHTADLDDNYDDWGSGHSVYATTSGTNVKTTTFSNSVGGSVRNQSNGTMTGCMVPMKPWDTQHEGFSVYLPYGEWADGDYVQFFHSSTYPSGTATNVIYQLEEVGSDYPNRFRLRKSNVTETGNSILEFTTVGNFGNSYNNLRQVDYQWHNTKTTPSDESLTVKVVAWQEDANKNVFEINGGADKKKLTLREGSTYQFDVSNSSNSGHVLRFATAPDAAGSTEYTTGVTYSGTPGTSGAWVKLAVPTNAPTLYYYCTQHAGMGNTIYTLTPAVNETGMNYGVWDPYNLTFEDAFFFKPAIEATVTSGSKQITFTIPHGLTDGKTYTYAHGHGNGVATGLTDSQWYYVKVHDQYTISLHTSLANHASDTRVNVTAPGTSPHGGRSRAAFIRSYTAESCNTAADEMTFNEVVDGAVTGGSQAYISSLTTMGGLSGWTNSDHFMNPTYETYLVYPKKVTNGGKTLSFSSTVNGSVKDLNNATVNGAIMKVKINPNKNTFYTDYPELYNVGDMVQHRSNGAATGMANDSYYIVSKKIGNRIGFKLYTTSSGAEINITTQGSVNTATTNMGTIYYTYFQPITSFKADGDFITSNNHGFNNGDLVVYSKGSGLGIYGLTDGQTYYVQNADANKFQVSTTLSGRDDSIDVATWKHTGNSFIGSNVNVYPMETTSTNHPFQTGDRVQYHSDTPVPGLQNGGLYYVRRHTGTYLRLYENPILAAKGDTHTLKYYGFPRVGQGTLTKTSIVDLKRKGTGTQTFNASTVGSSDGVYTIASTPTDTTFTLAASSQINDRVVGFNSDNGVWIEQDAMYLPDHFFVDRQAVTYATTGTVITGLTSGTTYYLIRISRNWIKLAASEADAIAGTAISLTGKGVGAHTLTAEAISGEVVGEGTVSVDAGGTTVTGVGTNFTSFFNTGDTITLYQNEDTSSIAVTGIAEETGIFTTAAHGLTTEDMVVMDAATAPTGTFNGYIYYVKVLSTTTFKLYPTAADATADTNSITVSSSGGISTAFKIYNNIGDTHTSVIKAVTGPGTLELNTASSVALENANYAIGTSLLMRADGFAIHRPYDGGVDLVPSKNPDSKMVRQTRRYFRYQSGKSIQVSFAVNFSPSTQIESYTYDASSQKGTIKTRYPHRLADSLSVVIQGATTSQSTNHWNGVKAIDSIVDDHTFKVVQGGAITVDPATGPGGLPEFYVQSWNNSALRCGLFDDQNGMYFEYDGSTLHCCRRSSVVQLSGTSTVTFRSGRILGNNTRFTKQVTVGDNIVIKGQTHVVTKITNDTEMFIMPSYRGVTNSNVIITKTDVTRIPQSQWNLDKCDGTGPTGFFLRPYRIQMAYIDYSWYGAGKVRFGFKDQRGQVVYVHEFVHNNHKNEAYLRSGNLPARYEIENVGTPTYVPALAHWGTSVIMDGKFDPDAAYLFTAASNNIQLTGTSTVTVSAKAETQSDYYFQYNNRWYNLGRALEIDTPSFLYNSIPANKQITGTNVDSSTFTRDPSSYYTRSFGLPSQPYLVSIRTRYGNQNASETEDIRNLLLINRQPTGTATSNSNYTVTLATTGAPVVYDVPLISIRLAPSVDTNTPGFLGEREIINRMQLILNSVGILSTHNCEVTLRLNGLTTNTGWQRVQNPSLSQLVYHTNQDTITGGIDIFEFRAQGGVGTSGRSALVTDQDLASITTLGNSILGGDNVFPDGPDVLTVVAKLSEDPSTVHTTNPFNVTARISWSESQA